MPGHASSDTDRDSDVEIVQDVPKRRPTSSTASSPTKSSPRRKKLLDLGESAEDCPQWSDLDDLLDQKPLLPAPSPAPAATKDKGKNKARVLTPEVLELSSGSDAEADAAVAAAQRARDGAHAALSQIRQMVPDVDPQFLLRMWVRCGRVPDRPRVEADELADDEDEVDELASDEDAAGEGEDEIVYTYDEAVDEEDYWLDVDQHAPGGNSYQKAALIQLFRDYDNITEAHIRKLFEQFEMLYAPAWFALYRLKKQGVLVELRGGPRDMDYIRSADGKVRKRDEGPQSKLLLREIAWLDAYVNGGGCKREAARNAPKEQQADPPRKKKKETKDERRARTQAKAGGASGSGAKKKAATAPKALPQKKQKKKKARAATPTDEEDDEGYGSEGMGECEAMARGWGPDEATFNKPQKKRHRGGTAYEGKFGGGVWGVKEEGEEAFSGLGFRLGD
ncbi:hypothetical protein JCM10450v2_002495 [Rhodotorula kratochvilovae]